MRSSLHYQGACIEKRLDVRLPCTLRDGESNQAVLEAQREGIVKRGDVGEPVEDQVMHPESVAQVGWHAGMDLPAVSCGSCEFVEISVKRQCWK